MVWSGMKKKILITQTIATAHSPRFQVRDCIRKYTNLENVNQHCEKK